MPDPRHPRGLVDTSVLIDLERIAPGVLPESLFISAISMAELAAGPHATSDPTERARRQETLQRVEATWEPLAVDAAVARAYGRVYAAVAAVGRKPRGQKALDLLIAATAVVAEMPLYTRNAGDFAELAGLLEVVAV